MSGPKKKKAELKKQARKVEDEMGVDETLERVVDSLIDIFGSDDDDDSDDSSDSTFGGGSSSDDSDDSDSGDFGGGDSGGGGASSDW